MVQEVPSEEKPARDERGRLLPGHSGNPSGLSKQSAEIKERCAAVLNGVAWEKLMDDITDPNVPAAVRLGMATFLRDTAYGKPGIRKEDREMDSDAYAAILPIVQISGSTKERLEQAGITPRLGSNKTGSGDSGDDE